MPAHPTHAIVTLSPSTASMTPSQYVCGTAYLPHTLSFFQARASTTTLRPALKTSIAAAGGGRRAAAAGRSQDPWPTASQSARGGVWRRRGGQIGDSARARRVGTSIGRVRRLGTRGVNKGKKINWRPRRSASKALSISRLPYYLPPAAARRPSPPVAARRPPPLPVCTDGFAPIDPCSRASPRRGGAGCTCRVVRRRLVPQRGPGLLRLGVGLIVLSPRGTTT